MSDIAPVSLADLLRRANADTPTVADVLAWRAAERPEATAFRFLRHGGAADAWTYGALEGRVSAWAAAVAEKTQPGDRVILLFQPGLDFIAAFLACQRAGTIPVPTALPRSREPQDRISALVANSRPALLLTHKDARSALAEHKLSLSTLETDALPTEAVQSRPARRTEIGFLQYTSGSTGLPKGVMISHRNIVANIQDIIGRFDLLATSRGVSWLPTYHDMGLIGCVLTPILLGAESALIAPATFLRDPLRWLQAISADRADISGGPNFAFDICARRLQDEATRPDPQDLDLSCWRVAFVGAEPVRAAMLTRFAAAAAPYGFRPDAFLPCYGLAEGTLFVAGASGTPGRLIGNFEAEALGQGQARPAPARPNGDKVGRRVAFVSCGTKIAAGRTRIAIVDPERRDVLRDGEVGEVWVSGPGVASGYWERPSDTAAAFGHNLPGRAEPYLRTGDVGFLHDDNLFISGRLHDVIIINGVKYHPEDIEQTIAARLPEMANSRAAVFAIEAETGVRVIVAQELAREQRKTAEVDRIAGTIRAAVWEAHGLAVDEAIVLSPGALPLTSSGKVQRQRCRDLYRSGELAGLAWVPQHRPAKAEEGSAASDALKLRAIVAEVLGRDLDQIELDRPLSWYALDSLKTTEVQMLAESRMGWELAGEILHSDMTLLQIAERRHTAGGADPGVFWMDTGLPAALRPAGGTPDGSGDALVTGATGLVGGHVVRELIRATEGKIVCLVRGDSDDQARRRLMDHLTACGISTGVASRRVEVIRGDAALPRFGVTEEAFAALAERVGVIFHNAAKLDFTASYGALRPANVGSVHQVLELAGTGRPKLLAHTSSISVIESPASPVTRVSEDASLDFPETLAIGYAQTKWVADVVISRARARGFAASIFRPSWIIAPEDGVVSGDFVARFIEGCRRIGAVPDSTYRWDLVPAEYVAAAIVSLTLNDRCANPVYHLGAARPLSVPTLVSRLGRVGARLSIVPIDEWRERLRQALASDSENPLRPVAGLFLRDGRGAAAADNYLLARVPEMDGRRTRTRLRRLGVADAAIDDSLFASLLRSGRRAAEQLAAAAE